MGVIVSRYQITLYAMGLNDMPRKRITSLENSSTPENTSGPEPVTKVEVTSEITPDREGLSPQEELGKLELARTQLKLVQHSLKLEERTGENAREAQTQARNQLNQASREAIRTGALDTPEQRVDVSAVEHAEGVVHEADSWAHVTETDPTIRYETGATVAEGPFADKLRSLGVDVEKNGTYLDGHYNGPVESAIAARLSDLDKEIKAKKLEIPGGKEELAVEAIRTDRLLEPVHIDRFGISLERVGSTPDMRPSISEIFNDLSAGFSRTRFEPLPVQEAVLLQVLGAVLEKQGRKGMHVDALENALIDYLELHAKQGQLKSSHAEENPVHAQELADTTSQLNQYQLKRVKLDDGEYRIV